MTTSGLQQMAQFILERVINSTPAGLLIAVFAWLLLRVIKRQNSGTRFAVWFSALLAVAVLPFVPRQAAGAAVARAPSHPIMLPGVWAVAIFTGWALIAAVAATQLVVGLWNLRKLRRNCVAIAPSDLPSRSEE